MKNQTHHVAVVLALLMVSTEPTNAADLPESLKKIEDQYVAAFQLHVEEGHQSKVGELNAKYLAALEKALQSASKGDRLEEALALKAEMKRVQEKEPLTQNDQGTKPVMVRLRNTYREQLGKLMSDRKKAALPIVKKFDEALVAHQSALTREGKIEDAAAVKVYREAGVAPRLLGETPAVDEFSNPPGEPIASQRTPFQATTRMERQTLEIPKLPSLPLSRPTRKGRLVLWPLYKDVTNHGGIGTLPEALVKANDIVAIAAFPTNVTEYSKPTGIGMALSASGTVSVWGDIQDGGLAPPDNLADVVEIAASKAKCYALTASGDAIEWGTGTHAKHISDIVRLCPSEWGADALAITSYGTIVGWTPESHSLVPEELSRVVDLRHTQPGSHWAALALLETGKVAQYGNVGDPPRGLKDVVAVRCGSGCYALLENGSCVGWPQSTGAAPFATALKDLRSVVKLSGRFVVPYHGTPHRRESVMAALDRSGDWHFFGVGLDLRTCERESKGCIDIAFGAEHAVGLRIEK